MKPNEESTKAAAAVIKWAETADNPNRAEGIQLLNNLFAAAFKQGYRAALDRISDSMTNKE